MSGVQPGFMDSDKGAHRDGERDTLPCAHWLVRLDMLFKSGLTGDK